MGISAALPDEEVWAGVDEVEEEGEDEAAPEELAPYLKLVFQFVNIDGN